MNIARALDLKLNAFTHRLRRVPVVALMPHSRCNCRCIMCDIWKANREGKSLAESEVVGLLSDFRSLGVEWVLLSGGEPLMHANLWALCAALKTLPVRITLLSTGLLLARHAPGIVNYCDDVIVSLDGSEAVHDDIRAIPHAFRQLAEGVGALKTSKPLYPVFGRCVLQRRNFADLPNIVATAKAIGLDRISFLAADVSSTAFNRPEGWPPDRAAEIALSSEDVERFAAVVEQTLVSRAADFSSGFIAESPAHLRRLVAYFRAVNGKGDFPQIACNAPWVSAVIEADGTVRPCFFHAPLGNIRERSMYEILNSPDAIAFRRRLDVQQDPICSRCVCTFKI